MIIEEFKHYTKGIPVPIVLAVLNNATPGVNWRGCSKKMICEDLFTHHPKAATAINARLFAEAIREEIADRRRAVKATYQTERDTEIAETRRLHAAIGGILRIIPNLQPMFASQRADLETFIKRHLPSEFRE